MHQKRTHEEMVAERCCIDDGVWCFEMAAHLAPAG